MAVIEIEITGTKKSWFSLFLKSGTKSVNWVALKNYWLPLSTATKCN